MGRGRESRSFSLISQRIFVFMDHHPLLLANKSGFIFPDTDFFFLNTLPSEPTEAARYRTPGARAPRSSTLFCLGISRSLPLRTPPPLKAKAGKARRKRASRKEERREQSGWLPGRDCGRWPGPPGRASSARAPEEAVHLFQSGGFYIKTNPPFGRPILSPAPASPS